MQENFEQTNPISQKEPSKFRFWLSVALIALIAIVLLVFFIFYYDNGILESSNNNTNTTEIINKNTNENTNLEIENNMEIELFNGSVSVECKHKDDCFFVDTSYDYSICFPPPKCPDYSLENYIGVNNLKFQEFINALTSHCDGEVTPDYSPPICRSKDNNKYTLECIDKKCIKQINE